MNGYGTRRFIYFGFLSMEHFGQDAFPYCLVIMSWTLVLALGFLERARQILFFGPQIGLYGCNGGICRMTGYMELSEVLSVLSSQPLAVTMKV